MKDGDVKVKRQSGDIVKIPLSQLTATDQEIVVKQLGAGERTWTDDSNRYHRQAEFAGVNGSNVMLKTTTGKTLSVPFNRLSTADQCVVRHLHGRPIREELVAPRTEHLVSR